MENSKTKVANEIKDLVSKLQSVIDESEKLGLIVDLSISKFYPKEPICVSIYEKTIY